MNPKLPSKKLPLLVFAIAIFVATVLAAVFALTSTVTRSRSPLAITLTVWGLEDESLYKQSFDFFLKNYPNTKIIYKQQNPKGYVARIKSRRQSQREGDKPDIFLFHNTWPKEPQFKALLAPMPQKILSTEAYKTTYYKVAHTDLLEKEAILGIPESVDNLVLVYNIDALAEKSLTPPENWETFRVAATRLTTKDPQGVITTSGAAIGTANNIAYFSDILGLMFVQQPETNFSLIGKDQEASSILEFYTEFVRKDQVWDTNAVSDIDAFAENKVAMIFLPARALSAIKTKNPSVRFATAPVPQLRADEEKAFASYYAWGVSKSATNTEMAWRLAYTISSKTALIRANRVRQAGGRGSLPYPRVDMAENQARDPLMTAFITQASFLASLPMASQVQDEAVNDKVAAILAQAVTTAANAKGISQDTSEKLVAILNEYGVTLKP